MAKAFPKGSQVPMSEVPVWGMLAQTINTVDDINPALPIIYHGSHSLRVLKVMQDLYHQQ